MKTADSQTLLAEYVRGGSEAAFRELVHRYLDLVYSTALRLVGGDTHLAEDIAQVVFTALAQKARTLSSESMLGGWLHRHTCYVASTTNRSERRRQARERQAMELNALEDHTQSNLAQIAPALDDAINQLGEEDRAAILLRFYEQQDFRSMGEVLGSSEDAARMRVNRALDKLHGFLERRGATISIAVLGTILANEAVGAAPTSLATSIAGAAMASAPATGTTLTFLKTIAMTKLQAAVAGGFILMCGITIGFFSQHQRLLKLRAENTSLREHTSTLSQLLEESTTKGSLRVAANEGSKLRQDDGELLRLRGEVGRLRKEVETTQGQSQTAKGVALNALQKMILPDLANAASHLAYFNNGIYPTNFDEVKAQLGAEILQRHDLTNVDDLGLDRFEFIPYEKPLTKDDYGKLLLRERIPRRRASDGRWVRVYTQVGCVVSEATSEDGNFEQWEREENERRLGAGRKGNMSSAPQGAFGPGE